LDSKNYWFIEFNITFCLDFFYNHLVDFVKQKFNKNYINIAIISDGLTLKLQPLDVTINKNFKLKISYFFLKNL